MGTLSASAVVNTAENAYLTGGWAIGTVGFDFVIKIVDANGNVVYNPSLTNVVAPNGNTNPVPVSFTIDPSQFSDGGAAGTYFAQITATSTNYAWPVSLHGPSYYSNITSITVNPAPVNATSVSIDAPDTVNPNAATQLQYVADPANANLSNVTWSIVSGGGSINPTTGVFTAPSTSGDVTVQVTATNPDGTTLTLQKTIRVVPAGTVDDVTVQPDNPTANFTVQGLAPGDTVVWYDNNGNQVGTGQTLTINNVTQAMDGQQYRAQITSGATDDNGNHVVSWSQSTGTNGPTYATLHYDNNVGSNNTGDNNTGNDNSGNSNVGDSNTGNNNVGSNNSGDNNSGNSNTGSDNSGNNNVGNSNVGSNNTGDNNTGNNNVGSDNVGNNNTGNSNTGDSNTGNNNVGSNNSGDNNTGNSNVGDNNNGSNNSGNDNSGNSNTGNSNTGNNNSGDNNTCSGNTGSDNVGNNNFGDSNVGSNNSGNDNSGNSNTGDSNTGNNNSGDNNTGNSNTGSDNVGNNNTGDSNVGSNNAGDNNTGNSNSGSDNIGDNNSGDNNNGSGNVGNNNSGNNNTGDSNTGNNNNGDNNTGNGNTGSDNVGDNNSGNSNVGSDNVGNNNSGNSNVGNNNSGDNNTGDSNTGNGNTGSNNVGDNNTGNNNQGSNNSGNNNTGNGSVGNSNIGNNNVGDNNVGSGNHGNNNTGNGNVGSNNVGNNNVGNGNIGNGFIGDNMKTPVIVTKNSTVRAGEWRPTDNFVSLYDNHGNLVNINGIIFVNRTGLGFSDNIPANVVEYMLSADPNHPGVFTVTYMWGQLDATNATREQLMAMLGANSSGAFGDKVWATSTITVLPETDPGTDPEKPDPEPEPDPDPTPEPGNETEPPVSKPGGESNQSDIDKNKKPDSLATPSDKIGSATKISVAGFGGNIGTDKKEKDYVGLEDPFGKFANTGDDHKIALIQQVGVWLMAFGTTLGIVTKFRHDD